MRYKVGEKVRVRNDIKAGECYCSYDDRNQSMDATDDMENFAGEVIEITGIFNGMWYICDEVSSYLKWADDMFEAVQKRVEVTDKEKSALYTNADSFFSMLTEELL